MATANQFRSFVAIARFSDSHGVEMKNSAQPDNIAVSRLNRGFRLTQPLKDL